MSLSTAFLDELRARTTLSTLIGRTTKLVKAGREYRACCPFHQEKTPSFYVNDEKGFYHCFGCSAHGDAIRWMTDSRGLPFIDAVKELAQAAGLDMPEQDRRSVEHAERSKGLHDVMADAAAWFTDQLQGLGGADTRALLDRRGVTAETARTFGLGFAPDTRGRLKDALGGYGDAVLVEAGLLIQVEDKPSYDRFRGRLMIPIRDARGRTIAFGGRIVGEGEPKYLNSPETPLFDKGRTLYNLDSASPAARKSGRVIVVEGYLDVIALAQAGFAEVVAPLGTALSEAQLERLWRMVDVPILCFDGDAAGRKAAIRAAHRSLPMLAPGRSLAFVDLPAGQDPDDLVRSGGSPAIERAIGEARPLVDLLWAEELASEPLDTPEQRAGLKQRIMALADAIGDVSVRTEYQSEFRRRFAARFAPPPRLPFQRRDERWTPRLPVSSDAKAVRAAGIDRVLAKAVLAGLIRHPAEIARHVEVLGSLRLADGALGRLFEAVIEVALEDCREEATTLDAARLATILAKSGFETIASDLLRADMMPYSFTRIGGDPERACADLDEAIAILVGRPELDVLLADATSAMQMRFTPEAYERQIGLVKERHALDLRLANLVQATEDARALAPEED